MWCCAVCSAGVRSHDNSRDRACFVFLLVFFFFSSFFLVLSACCEALCGVCCVWDTNRFFANLFNCGLCFFRVVPLSGA
jgi:hypothetical protein